MRVAATAVAAEAEIGPRTEAPAETLANGTAFAPTLEQTIRASQQSSGEGGDATAGASSEDEPEEKAGHAADAGADAVAVLCATSSFLAALCAGDPGGTDLGVESHDGEAAILGFEDVEVERASGGSGKPSLVVTSSASASAVAPTATDATPEAASEASSRAAADPTAPEVATAAGSRRAASWISATISATPPQADARTSIERPGPRGAPSESVVPQEPASAGAHANGGGPGRIRLPSGDGLEEPADPSSASSQSAAAGRDVQARSVGQPETAPADRQDATPVPALGPSTAETAGAKGGDPGATADAALRRFRAIRDPERAVRDPSGVTAPSTETIAEPASGSERGGRRVATGAAAGNPVDARAPLGTAGVASEEKAGKPAPANAAYGTLFAMSDAGRSDEAGAVVERSVPELRPDRGPLLRRSRRTTVARGESEATATETASARRAGRSSETATNAESDGGVRADAGSAPVAASDGAAIAPPSPGSRAALATLDPASIPEKGAAPDGTPPSTANAAASESSAAPRPPVAASVLPGSRTGLPSWAERIGELAKLEHLPARSEMRIELEPEGLGRLDVRLRIVGGELHASIVTDHEQTRGLLVRQQHLLEAALQKSEVRLFQLDVDVRGDAERRAPQMPMSERGERWDAPLGWSGTTEDRRDAAVLLATPVRTGRLSVRA